MRKVMCSKLKKELEGLERPTYPGELGKKVFDNISKEAWAMWLKHMTMLINEYRLTPIEPKAKTYGARQLSAKQILIISRDEGIGVSLKKGPGPLDVFE